MKIGIYYKQENHKIVEQIKKEIKKYELSIDNRKPDIVFSVGGDGTFLRAVHMYMDRLNEIHFIGINSGSLGFFYDFSKEEIPQIVESIANKTYALKEHALLKGEVKFKKSETTIYALNEIRIENPFHTLISDVFINKEKLENYRGNGLIVASTLGSSAYNKSLGGALIDNDLDALELTEIAGIQNNVYRSLGSSLVIKGDKSLSFSGQLGNSVVGYDHLNIQNDDSLLELKVSYCEKKVKIIYSENHSYIQKIRKSFVL